MTAGIDLDADLDALQQEREFLLRSLRDLEAEHQAGDIDETDYGSLRDDYTARAAAVLRAIEKGRGETTLTFQGKLMVFVSRFLPRLADRIAARRVRAAFQEEMVARGA